MLDSAGSARCTSRRCFTRTSTPSAVAVPFEPTIEFDLEGSVDYDALVSEIDRRTPPSAPSCAVRIDGRFERIRARSVPRQEPPYRPLTEVAADQRVFELCVDLADRDATRARHQAIERVEREPSA